MGSDHRTAALLILRWMLAIFAGLGSAGIGAHIYAKRQLAKVQPLKANPAVMHAKQAETLIIGDSRVAQWPESSRPPGSVTAGFPGAAAISIGEVASQIFVAVQPKQVVIQAGFNDASAAAFAFGGGKDAIIAAAAEALARMAREARNAGADRVIVMTVVPAISPGISRRLLYGKRQDVAIAELNRRLRKLREAGVVILEVEPLLLGADGRADSRYSTDSVHWSPAAYTRISAALAAMLNDTSDPVQSKPKPDSRV